MKESFGERIALIATKNATRLAVSRIRSATNHLISRIKREAVRNARNGVSAVDVPVHSSEFHALGLAIDEDSYGNPIICGDHDTTALNTINKALGVSNAEFVARRGRKNEAKVYIVVGF
jgi:hypothetical protein